MGDMLDGKYALITGASQGLGKNMVIECARRNMHIIAVALPGPELDAIKGLISHNYAVQIEAIGSDLSTEEGCQYVYDTVQQMGVRINFLINCAGISLTKPFHEIDPARVASVVRLNVLGTTMMTRLFIDDLLATAPSYVLSVSSLGSYFHLPNKQVYGASKAYVYSFSRNMQTEYRNKGINITVLCPGGLSSNIRSVTANNQGGWIAKQSITPPEFVAKKAIQACLKGKDVVIPGKINKIFLLFNSLIPSRVKGMIMTVQMNKLVEKKSPE
jgi:short-subunit dehydrogenase